MYTLTHRTEYMRESRLKLNSFIVRRQETASVFFTLCAICFSVRAASNRKLKLYAQRRIVGKVKGNRDES